MTITQDFLISLLHEINNNFSCYLMTSNSKLIDAIQRLRDVRIYNQCSDILLNTENKNEIIKHVLAFNSEENISHFELFIDDMFVFMSHDGFKINVISPIIPLSKEFVAKFVDSKMCTVINTKTITQDFFISVLHLFKKDGLFCEFQSMYDNLLNAVREIDGAIVKDSYSAYFPFNDESRSVLIDSSLKHNSEMYIHHFEILEDNKIVFISHDEFEVGTISSSIFLPEIFISKFVKTDICWVAENITPYM